jgi:hypothetical protein
MFQQTFMPSSDPSAVRAEVLEVLRQLRGRIRRYVALEGVALVLVVIGLAFWFSLAADYSFELPITARRFVLVLALAAAAFALVWFLLLRLIRDFRNRALALVLERRFPQLNDRLITAVELSDSAEETPPLTAAMLQRTASEAAESARALSLREVFNRGPLLKATFGAAALIVSIGAFGFASTEVFQTWFRRNLLLADEYYRRETDFTVVVLADPGERIVEFRGGVYKHPRGADLTFLASVPDGKIVPDEVQLSYRNVAHSGGGNDTMTRVGERQFRHRLAGLHEDIRLWISGGDYSTRQPYVIEIVDPPQVDRMVLSALYPEHTRLNPRDESSAAPVRQAVPVLGTQVSLPAGTDFLLEARTNKPLQGVQLQSGLWELNFTRDSARLKVAGTGDTPPAPFDLTLAQPLLSDDGQTIRIPCALAVAAAPEVVSEAGHVHLPLRLAPDSLLRITLHDDDDIISAEPARLTVSSIPDEPPHIETRLKGIGTSITRQATIPVMGEIQDPQDGSKRYGVTDDYGIAEARFEYKVESAKPEAPAASWQPTAFANQPEGRRQFPIDEKFAVLPLDLAVGARFTLKVIAADADNLTGPHVSSGQPWGFQIVSDDELLALIAVKELNLRRRFEQIVDEVKSTRKELLLARTRLEETRKRPPAGGEAASRAPAAVQSAALTTVERAISGIRKNANETQSIEVEFGDIRDELENNAIPDARPMLDRIDEGIIRPLHSVNTVDYNELDDALAILRKALEDEADPLPSFEEPVDRINVTIDHLDAVLAQILKLETVNEALQLLRDIIKSQEDLQDKTRQERKKKLIEGLQ